jgi:hypothetical protein
MAHHLASSASLQGEVSRRSPASAGTYLHEIKPDGIVRSRDVPSYRSYPPGFIVKLLASRIAMALGK